MRQAERTELAIKLEGRRPEMPAITNSRRAQRVDRDERADGDAARQNGRCRAEAALDGGRQSAGTGAGGSGRERRAGATNRLEAEFAIGRVTSPVLVATVDQVEQDGGGHDRYPVRTDGKAAAHFSQRGLGSGRSVEAKGRTAGKH
ncbi:hypothetical protein D9M72_590820 [compost metagenome]